MNFEQIEEVKLFSAEAKIQYLVIVFPIPVAAFYPLNESTYKLISSD
jgi:hypothetical protein